MQAFRIAFSSINGMDVLYTYCLLLVKKAVNDEKGGRLEPIYLVKPTLECEKF